MDTVLRLISEPQATLGGLFIASLLAATVLPGGSEIALFAVLRTHPEQWVAALVVATIGNTLGGMSTYMLGRLAPAASIPERIAFVRRYGSAALALAWAPLVGDALCAAAGWLRLNWAACLAWMAAGKLARYLAIALATA